jgi:succinyl-diaminopimelate desuccinylase
MARADRTLDLVNIPSESRDEAVVYAYVKASVGLETVYDDGESVIFARRSGKPLVLLAGHTDTVPAQGNLPGRIDDGAVIGLGASDMKGGLAVMIELAAWARDADLAYDLAFLFFPRSSSAVAASLAAESGEPCCLAAEAAAAAAGGSRADS